MAATTELTNLRTLYSERRKQIRRRLKDFCAVPEREYFYELAYCLLTPQSSAVNAEKTIERIRTENFVERGENPEHILRTKEHYIRFHRTKAKHLLRLREQFPFIRQRLKEVANVAEKREMLVKNVKGLGYKEATHFLRNIGKNEGLAILDRHILRNLKRFGAIRSVPKTMTKKHYFVIERKFQEFSKRVGIPLDELDLLFWSMETGEILK